MPFSLVLYCQPPSRATASLAWLIVNDMTEGPQLKRFRSRFTPDLEVLSKHMDAKHSVAQASYKCKFKSNVRSTSQYQTGQHIFVRALPEGMPESARMANAPLPKLLPKTHSLLKGLSARPNTVTKHENDCQRSLLIQRVTLVLYSTQRNDRTDGDRDTQNGRNCRNKDKTDEKNECIIRDFAVVQKRETSWDRLKDEINCS